MQRPKITLITPTGGRGESFSLCERWMRNQTIWSDEIQWLLIDDCTPRTEFSLGQEYHRGPKEWKSGINTQRLNMDLALTKVKGDYIFIIEDDDYYAPTYLETMLDLLKHFNVVGEGNAKYYSLTVPGYKEMRNQSHASLCQTALRKEQLPLLESAVNSGEIYFDIVFWSNVADENISSCLFYDKNLAVGVKGMPGRFGIGVGHKQKDYYFDANCAKLSAWIGNDAQFYEPIIRELKNVRTKEPRVLRHA